MFRRVFLVGILAGFVAGLALTTLEQLKLAPLIAAAEVYESAAEPHQDAMPAMANAAQAWEPSPGFERIVLTFLAEFVIAAGFGLVLSGGFALREACSGQIAGAREGLLWGFAGFAAFALAPALGLPPEPPGMVSADILARQGWWLGTALATACGIGLLVFGRHWAAHALGIAVIILPQLIGAPARPEGSDAVTADIAAHFVAASLVTSAVFWILLGSVAGWLYAAAGKRGAARGDVLRASKAPARQAR